MKTSDMVKTITKTITKTKVKTTTAVITIIAIGGLLAGMMVVISRNINAENKSNQKTALSQNEAKLSQSGNDKYQSDEEVTAEITKVKAAIKEKKAKWEAGPTSMNKLKPKERQKYLGEKEDLQAAMSSSTTGQAQYVEGALASTLDWRNNGGNFVTPVKNQGSCGSCWAFAATANAESANLIKAGTPYSSNPLNLSEQVVVSCSGAGSCSGGSSGSAGSFFVSTGAPVESCYTYTATNGSCTSACANWQMNTYKIDNQLYAGGDLTTIKNALTNYGPMLASFAVYGDFMSYRSGVYSYTTGDYKGSHAVQVVGYDDINQCFIVKNSWGTGWGEAGFFRIAYSEMTSGSGFRPTYVYNTIKPLIPDTELPTASITSPAEGSTVKGTTAVNVSASDNIGISKVDFFANGSLIGSDSSSPYSYSWDTNKITNGSYALAANVYDTSNNKGTASAVNVTVANIPDASNPSVTINSPAAGSKLPAKGTVVISATATDDVGVIKIEILVDNKLKTTCTQATCSYSLNTTSLKKGTHTISAKAYDASGKVGNTSITVTK